MCQINWKNASRTDAGVHACAQIVSFYAENVENVCCGDIPNMINNALPHSSTINVLGCINFPRVFDSQKFASARNYNYLIPVSAFKSSSKEHLNFLRNEICPLFVGSLNFHNFTKLGNFLKADRPSAIRTIHTFTFSDPFSVCGVECVLFTINGISFMLNQIRKMIALVIYASHGFADKDIIQNCFSTTDWAIKKCPGEGLMLDKVEYPESINKSTHKHPLTIESDVEFTEFRPVIERWKREVLFPHIINEVKIEQLFKNYINNVVYKFPIKTVDEIRAQYHKNAE